MLPSTKKDVLRVLVIKGEVHKTSTSTIVIASENHSKSSNFHFSFIHDYILLYIAPSSMNSFMPLDFSMSRVEMTETNMFTSTGPTSKEVRNITSRNTPMLQPLVPYDPYSIMHYHHTAFAINKRQSTIISRIILVSKNVNLFYS